jgi:hypothetical protein
MSLSSVKSETALRSWLFSRSRSLRRFTCSVFSPRRFVQGYRDSIDWMYAGDEALKAYAEFAKVRLDQARRVRDEFFPKKLVWPDRVRGLDTLMEDGVTFKYLSHLRRNGWLK